MQDSKAYKIFLLILFSISSIFLKAQSPTGLPLPNSPTAYYHIGWIKTDSGTILANRDTTLRPLYAGTSIFWQHAGVDSVGWVWDGFHWKKGGGVSAFNLRSGSVTLLGSDVTGALGYTPLQNITNYLQQGTNVTVTGLGTLASPYIINSTGGGGGGGTVTSFSFTNGNGITGSVSNATTTPNLSVGTSLTGIINGNGTGFGTVGIGSGLNYSGGVLSATEATSLNGLVSANGSAFTTASIGAGLSFSGNTLTNTINNTNQLTNGANFLTNITSLISQGTNVTITGSGTTLSPYVINSSGSGSGTVTTFSSGNLSPLFTTSVSNPNTVPALSFSLTNAAANSVFGNNTGSTGAPVYYVPTITTLNGWASGSIALLGATQTFTAANTFNGSVVLGSNTTFSADNTYSVGSGTAAAAHVWSRVFNSDGIASLSSATGNSANLSIGATAGITLLSTGQAQFNNYTGSGFSGTSADSVLTVNPANGQIGWKWFQPFYINAVQGLSPIGTGAADSLALGGIAGAFYQNDSLYINGHSFLWYGLPNESSIASTDSFLLKKSNGAVVAYATIAGIGAGSCSNCNVTFDALGREVGYSTGTATSTFWRPEDFGGVGDGITDCTAALNACDSAAAFTKGTCLIPEGTYLVHASSLKTSTAQQMGIKMWSNTTFTGQGPQSIIKLAPPPSGATFGPVSAPLTWTTNANFYSIFNLDTVSNVTIENLTVYGNVGAQINKDQSGSQPLGAPNPYKNPQNGTTTPNVQTNTFLVWNSPNTTIYNVTIDSVVGYGIEDANSPNNNYSYLTIHDCINGGVLFAANDSSRVAGSVLYRSLVTNNNSDNVRLVDASYVSIINNEISWAKPQPISASVNFAGVYLESDVGTAIQFDNISDNYIHDNSAFGIDQSQIDTVVSTYRQQSTFITDNQIYDNGAGGVQVALPYTTIKVNNFYNEGERTDGFIDSASQCDCGIHVTPTGYGVDATANNFRDSRKIMRGGALSVNTPVQDLTFTNNKIRGMSRFSQVVTTIYSGPPYNNIWNNPFVDTAGGFHVDVGLDQNGNMVFIPSTGQLGSLPGGLILGNNTAAAIFTGQYFASGSIKSTIFQGASQNGGDFGTFIDEDADYLGVGRGTLTGRQIYWGDLQTGARRVGIDSSGALTVGSGTTTGASGVGWAVKMQQPVALNATYPLGVDINYAHTSGSANFTLEAALKAAIGPGYTGTQGYMIAGQFLNTNTDNSGAIAGAGGSLGNFGVYSQASGVATGGTATNFGGQFLASNALRNVSLFSDATFNQYNNAGASSIGALIYAKRANASALELGAYIGTQSGTPTLTSAALIVDNGAESIPIAKFQVGNADKVIIDATGKFFQNTVPDSTATPNGGFLFRNANTGEYELTPAPSGGSTPTLQQVLTAGSTLTGNNTITLGSNNLSFSGGGSGTGVAFNSSLYYSYTASGNANLTVADGVTGYVLSNPSANRTITMPTASTELGRVITFFNGNFSFTWSFTSVPVVYPDGSSLTTLATNTYYVIQSIGGAWTVISQIAGNNSSQLRYGHTIFTPSTGGTVALVDNQYNIINPSGTLLALTVNLPSSPVNNDVVYVKFTQAVGTVTYSNGTVLGGLVSPIIGSVVVFTYDQTTSTWY